LSTAKAKGNQTSCMSNLRQLVMAAHMYAADYDSKLVPNATYRYPFGPTNTWLLGDMKFPLESTNVTLIRQGKLFPYASNEKIYRCVADQSRTGAIPRVRSYAMNGWMGSRSMESFSTSGTRFRTFVKESEMAVAGASTLWLMMDEDEASIDDAWFLVTMDDSLPFASLPSGRHRKGYALNFVDGHVEVYKWGNIFAWSSQGNQAKRSDFDWIRLKQVTTIR